MGTRHQPHNARSCELALRAVGAARGRPGGAPLAWAWGVRGRALSHPQPLVLWGVLPGPTTHWLWVRGVRAWGPVTDPTACALASRLCALWGRHEGAGRGRLLPGRGASGVGRSPTPDRPSFGACGGGPLPTGCGCGGCGRGNPSPTPQRALLRAGFARRRGGTRAPGVDASCLGVGRLGSGALPPPTARPLGRAARAQNPMAVGAEGAGVGYQPHSACSCVLALRAVGAAPGRPGGGAYCLRVGRPGSGALPPRPLVLWGVLPGPTTRRLWVQGLRARGTVTYRTVCALARSLCALWGRQKGARGEHLLPGCGASRVGRSPSPDRWSFEACGRGPLPTGCGCGVCGREDPSPNPQRALLRAGFARCGGGTRAPGGAPLAWVWGARGRALSHLRPLVLWGVLPGPTTQWLWVRRVRAWQPVTNPTARAIASWLCALWGRHEGARGGRLLPGSGASGVGRSPNPDRSSIRACGRGPLPTGCGCGGGGPGDPSPTPQRALLRAGFVGCGGGTRAPRGAPLACVWGVWGRALSHPPLVVLWGVGPGSATHWLWLPCAGVGARLSLAPSPVPRFVVRCVRFPCLPHQVAVVAWHLSSCRGCGRRCASLGCLVVPRWRAAPRPVRSLSVLRSAFPSPWCLPPRRRLSAPALLGGFTGHVEAGREPGSLCLPLAPAEARPLGALRVVPVRGPAMGLSLAGSSGFGLGLRALPWFGVCGPGH